ncbi:uncharacterized protein LOC122994024 [Thunnus albacares]|uniref:uncharacterized protein LOC122994024 n=1 Tax=Thunnus albacares TaxID=8236 RepID=UPI001CF60FAF|nr:uncharacterized protein LOC122994024 [Thunnus albacares]
MALVILLFAVCVLHSWETQGSTAVTPVFVKQGDDVLLEVKEPVVLTEGDDFFWMFSQTYSVVQLSYDNKIIIFEKYSGRAELSDQNGSLLLKNLQQADSGRYVAQVIGERDRNIAEYKVIVQNPVTPVKLSVDSVSNSTESCNLTVSCRTERSHISSTFRCDTQTCNQMGGEQPEDTSSDSSLHVYLLNDHIICNHSNQVNWTKDLKKIRTLCPLNTDPVTPVNLSVDSVSNSIESCNLTVSCSTERSHISSTFRCDTQTCYQKGGEQSEVTSSDSSLRVYLLNDFIICNHSNQVNWTKDLKKIQTLCPLNTDTIPNGSLTIDSWIGIIVGCLVVILCICFGLFIGITIYQQKRKKTCENTIYASPQNINPAQRPNQNATEDASGLSPESTYALVGFPTRPTGSTESKNITPPDTTYAQVTKAQLSNHHPELKNTDKIHSQD